MTQKIIDNTFEVLAIELLSVVQAVDSLNFEDHLSTEGKKYYHAVREIVPVFSNDEIFYPKLEKVRNFLKNYEIEYLF